MKLGRLSGISLLAVLSLALAVGALYWAFVADFDVAPPAPRGRDAARAAALSTTAFIKEAGGDRVTILGEPVGDRLAFFSEGGDGCLPHSGYCMSYATGKHDYGRPCTDWRVCFWLDWLYRARVASLQPDQPIALRFADWNAGHDVALERAVALAATR